MKKILSVVLVLCMVLGIMPITASADVVDSGTCGENLTWELDSEGTLTISGTGDMYDYGIVFALSGVEKEPEVELTSNGSFSSSADAPWSWYSYKITKIVVGEGVTSIGKQAFISLIYLEEVSLPETLTKIGVQAFAYCDELTEITFPDSLEVISASAFGYCYKLANITIPKSVTSVDATAFEGTKSLNDIFVSEDNQTYASLDGILVNKQGNQLLSYPCGRAETSYAVPASITSVGPYAFYQCFTLEEVILHDSIEFIGEYAFDNCVNLREITIPDKITELNDGAFYCCTSLTKVTLPDTLKSIGKVAFSCCSITEISIPDSVEIIGDGAFGGCDQLKSISFSKNVSYIGISLLADCYALESVEVDPDNAFYMTDDNILFDKEQTRLLYYPINNTNESYTVPATIKVIEPEAFESNKHLTQIILPDGLETIGNSAFIECVNLENITLPDRGLYISNNVFSYTAVYENDANWENNVLYIGNHLIESRMVNGTYTVRENTRSIADYGLYGLDLSDVILPDTIEIIGKYAFGYSPTLKSITIPKNTKIINSYAFKGCSALTDVYYGGSEEDWNNITIGSGNEELLNAKVHCNEKNTIVDSGTCGENLTWELDSEGTLIISGEGAMDYSYEPATNDSARALPPWTQVPWYAHSLKIKKAVVEPGVTTLADYAFYECVNMSDVSIPDSITSIGVGAFCSCEQLKVVHIPDGVKVLEQNLFRGCTNLDEVVIPDSVTDIGYRAFNECYSLTDITIPDGVITISTGAFYQCPNLKELNIPSSVTDIGSYAFSRCSSLNKIDVDENNPAYVSCDGNLFTKDMTVLEQYATGKDDKKYVIPDGVKQISHSAFFESALVEVIFPEGLETIGGEAFFGCPNLLKVDLPDSVVTIADSAFSWCRSLTEVKVPSTVERMGMLVFAYCTSLKKADFPKTENYILQQVFEGCSSLESYVIPDNIVLIGSSVFKDCSSLKSVVIPKKVRYIYPYSFSDCPLTDIYYEGTEEEWENIDIGIWNTGISNATIHYNCTFDATVDATVKEAEDAILAEVDLGEDNRAKRLIVDGQELYYSVQRGKYVGLVPGDNVADNKLTDVVIADADPTTFVYGNVDGKDDFTSFEDAIKNSDLLNMKLYLAGANQLETKNLIAADLNGDGKCTTGDILALKVYMTNGTQFPILR